MIVRRVALRGRLCASKAWVCSKRLMKAGGSQGEPGKEIRLMLTELCGVCFTFAFYRKCVPQQVSISTALLVSTECKILC